MYLLWFIFGLLNYERGMVYSRIRGIIHNELKIV